MDQNRICQERTESQNRIRKELGRGFRWDWEGIWTLSGLDQDETGR